jgi:hypothetical protein
MALGDRGSAVKDEQRRLNDLGADPPLKVDGIWGPKTQAAHEKYGSAGGGTTASTGSSSDLLLPGNAQLWHNETSGEDYVVYEVPGVRLPNGTASEPVFTAWLIESDADLTAVVGPDKKAIPHFSGSEADFTEKGVIHLGGVDELRVSDLEGDPFDTWVEDMTALAAVKPWILDDDYIGLVVQAAMERVDGRISLEEIQGTNWWKTHNAGERAWMETFNSDPETAEQTLEDNRASLRLRLSKAGIDNATPELVNWMADRTTMGVWGANHLDSQIAAISDPYSVDVIDDDLFEFMANSDITLDHTQIGEDRVRELVHEWLGPVYGNWSDSDIADQAGLLRNDPDAEAKLIESLKDQRVAMYPGQTDRDLSYQSIARPWKTYAQGIWGAPAEDTDEVFQQVLQVNDPREAGKLLRQAGLDRGYEKTVSDVVGGIQKGMKANVRGAV